MPPKRKQTMTNQEEREYATSIVRFSCQPACRDKIGASEQWFTVMGRIKQQPNFGFICKGESIDDELDITLFIAWESAAKPPAAFLLGNIDSIFSPLHDFVTKQPQVVGTLYQMINRPYTSIFRTDEHDSVKELMTVRGPAHAIKSELEGIESDAAHYRRKREIAAVLHGYIHGTFSGLQSFRLDAGGGLEAGEDPTDQATCTFALLLYWRDEQGRAEFKDPNIPDSSLPPDHRFGFTSDYWQRRVIKRLEGLGASVSSWAYHKATVARDGNNKLVIADGMFQKYAKVWENY